MKSAAHLPVCSINARALATIASVSVLLTGCNGFSGDTLSDGGSGSSGAGSASSSGTGGGGTTPPIQTYTVGGTVSGLAMGATGLIIGNGTGNSLPIVSNGRFVLPQSLAPGAPYQVTVQTQPGNPLQLCRVSAGNGIISASDITNVSIKCAAIGKFLFAVNPFDNNGNGTVAAFTIDPTTGALTSAAGSPYVPTEINPYDVAVDPTGQYIYVANAGSANVSTDSVGAGGVLTLDFSTASTGSASNLPSSIAIDASDKTHPYLYVGSDDNPDGVLEAYSIAAGELTPVGGTLPASVYPAGDVPYSLAVDQTSGLLFGADFYSCDIFDYSIDATTGTLTAVAGSPFSLQASNPQCYPTAQAGQPAPPPVNQPYAVAVYPGARYLYVTDTVNNAVDLFDYDVHGVPTLVAVYDTGASVGLLPQGLTIDPTGSFLYVANSGNGSVSAFRIDRGSGALNPVAGSPYTTSGVATMVTAMSVRVDPSSQFAYVSNGDAGTISVFAINFSSGALTPVGAPIFSILATGGTGGPSALAIE